MERTYRVWWDAETDPDNPGWLVASSPGDYYALTGSWYYLPRDATDLTLLLAACDTLSEHRIIERDIPLASLVIDRD